MKRQEDEAEKENSERWLLTYSDMITLLMIFFIIMYTMSSVNQAKFQALAESMNMALAGGTGMFDAAGPSMVEGLGTDAAGKTEAQMLAEAKQELDAYLKKEGLETTVTVSSEERGLVISFQEMILFESGEADLTPQARSIVSKVGATIGKLPNYVRVEGHTCDLPIKSNIYRSNWELSAARALTVVHEFAASGKIAPQRLSATAYGEYRPRNPNDSEKHRALNRRVDIVVLNSKYKEIEPYYQDTPGSQFEQEQKIEDNSKTQGSENDAETGTNAAQEKEKPKQDTTYVP